MTARRCRRRSRTSVGGRRRCRRRCRPRSARRCLRCRPARRRRSQHRRELAPTSRPIARHNQRTSARFSTVPRARGAASATCRAATARGRPHNQPRSSALRGLRDRPARRRRCRLRLRRRRGLAPTSPPIALHNQRTSARISTVRRARGAASATCRAASATARSRPRRSFQRGCRRASRASPCLNLLRCRNPSRPPPRCRRRRLCRLARRRQGRSPCHRASRFLCQRCGQVRQATATMMTQNRRL